MSDCDFDVEMDGVGREIDRRHFLKLLGAAGAVVGTIEIMKPVDAPPLPQPEVSDDEPVELLRARITNGDDVVAETLVPTVRRTSEHGLRWEPVGGDWRFHNVPEDLHFDDIQIAIPDEVYANLKKSLGLRLDQWRSSWKKDGRGPITAKKGDDLTLTWSGVALLRFE